MKIYVDERETALYNFLIRKDNTIEKQVLTLGDIIIKDEEEIKYIIERKTITDLIASIKDGRYKEQSHRLMHTSEIPLNRIIYIIEGLFNGQTELEKQIVYSSMVSLNQFKGFSVMRTWCLEETGIFIMNMKDKIERELKNGKKLYAFTPNGGEVQDYTELVKKTKKDNITSDNIGSIMLSQIPGISSITANSIMREYSSFSRFMEELKTNPEKLETITITTNGKTRKINKTCIENIKKYLM